MIALASCADSTTAVQLEIDWKASGMDEKIAALQLINFNNSAAIQQAKV